jgi:site-specific DNA-methyltransferase (adenine-specific)
MGPDCFKSEIIWHYRRWSNSTKTLLPAHQTIYFYVKSPEHTFNVLWEDYSPSTNVDQILQRRARDGYGKTVYQRDEFGDVIANGGKKGVPLSDVWDIPYLNPKAKERTGYPTQKPLTLLERIIQIATHENDWVLDPFCGSGTTLVAAKMLHRNALGMDISDDAMSLTLTRLKELQKSESHLLARGRNAYRNADKTALAFLRGLDYVQVHRNKGIDAILKENFDGTPVPIRVQREGETIIEAASKLYYAAKGKNVRVMFLVAQTSGGYLTLGDDLPPGIVVINSPALEIREYLDADNPALSGNNDN